jgi:hypothetical protein
MRPPLLALSVRKIYTSALTPLTRQRDSMSVANSLVAQQPANPSVANPGNAPNFHVPQPVPLVPAQQQAVQVAPPDPQNAAVPQYRIAQRLRALHAQEMTNGGLRPANLPMHQWERLNNHTKKVLTTPGGWAQFLMSHPGPGFSTQHIFSHIQTKPPTAHGLHLVMSRFIEGNPGLGFTRDVPRARHPSIFYFNKTPG